MDFDSRNGLMAAPLSLESARRRRRNVLSSLFGASVVLLLAAITVKGIFVLLFLVSLAALLGFVMLVVNQQRMATESRNKVQPIFPVGHQPPLQSAPSYLVRRSSAN